MKIRDGVFLIVIGILIALLVFGYIQYNQTILQAQKEADKREYWEEPGFKSMIDSLDQTYKEWSAKRPIYNTIMPEKLVQVFLRDTQELLRLRGLQDSLLYLLDSLGNVAHVIDPDFLTQYPNTSKLLGARFTSDSLTLDLMGTDGTVGSHLWLVNYPQYSYQWDGEQMRTLRNTPLLPSKKPHKLNHAGYVHGGYNVLPSAGYARFDYFMEYRRFTFNLSAGSTISNNPQPELKAGLGYKVF
jgi:hypothetical protein